MSYSKELTEQLFAQWCDSKGLQPNRCDSTNVWIRLAFEGAMEMRDRFTGWMPVPAEGGEIMQFMLEAANEGEWAAYEHGCRSCEVAVANILDGNDTGAGSTNEPWNTLRKRLLEMKDKADAVAQVGWRWIYSSGRPSDVFPGVRGPTETALAAANSSSHGPVTVQKVYAKRDPTSGIPK